MSRPASLLQRTLRSALQLGSTLVLLACRPEPSAACIEPSPARRSIAIEPSEPTESKGLASIEPTTVIEGPMPSDLGVPPRPGELRFLDSDPHVPFFAIDPDHGLVQPRDACLRWGVIGSRWWALDPWGSVVGEYELQGGEGYSVTNCYELKLTRITGEPGTGLLVTGPYRAVEAMRWQPDARQLARLDIRVDAIDAIFELPGDPPASLPERTLAYRRNQPDEGLPREWVAVGGRWLGLFSLEADGNWQLRHIDTRLATDRYLPADAQRPIAAIDLDSDGDPS